MKAVAKTKAAPGLELIEVPTPNITSHCALVKVKAASICGSDVHLYNWDDWAQSHVKPPVVIGHECAGEVVEIGSQVEHIKVGDRVSLESHIPCQGCRRCRNGDMHLCTHLETIGFDRDGGFAEYISMPEVCCIPIPDDMPWEIASIQEPLGNSVYAVAESDVAGRSAVIFGDGPTGLFAVSVARQYGAAELIAVGASPYRLEIMRQLGADHVLDARTDDVRGFIKKEMAGEGVDVVIEMSGAEAAINDGFHVLRKGGTFTAFGIPPRNLSFNIAESVILKGIKVVGIHGRRMFDTWNRMRALFESGKLDVSPVISHQMALEEFDNAMQLLTAKPIQASKIVLKP